MGESNRQTESRSHSRVHSIPSYEELRIRLPIGRSRVKIDGIRVEFDRLRVKFDKLRGLSDQEDFFKA